MEDNKTLKVFSSVQYKSKYLGTHSPIFEHSPDVCWVGAGWTALPTQFLTVTAEIGTNTVQAQRRIYKLGPHKELCYFFSLIDGKPPSTLDGKVFNAIVLFDRERNIIHSLKLFAARLLNIYGTIFDSSEAERECVQFVRVIINFDSDTEDSELLLKDFLANCVFSKDPAAEP